MSTRILLTAIAVALVAVPVAGAEPLSGSSIPVPLEPAANAEIEAGTVPTFRFERGPGGSNYGGRYDGTLDRYAVAVSRDPTVLADGTIQSEVEHGLPTALAAQGPWAWTPLDRRWSASWWLATPGVYYWQVYRSDCYQDDDCRVEGPIRRLTVVPAAAKPPVEAPAAPPVIVPPVVAPAPPPEPAPARAPRPPAPRPQAPPRPAPPDPYEALGAGTIPPRFGRARDRRRFRVNVRSAPSGIWERRWLALAVDSGQRWGHRYRGRTWRGARGDGVNVVTFGRLPRGVLGATLHYARVRTGVVCRGPGIFGGCRRRVVSRRPTRERDVVIARGLRWEEGPAYPSRREWDLQTVLVHEFGHVTGFGHVRRPCADHPMIVAATRGDYWRAPRDRSLAFCRRTALRAAGAPPIGRFLEIHVDVVVDGARRRGG